MAWKWVLVLEDPHQKKKSLCGWVGWGLNWNPSRGAKEKKRKEKKRKEKKRKERK